MSVKVSKAGGFFVVRSDGVQDVGMSWPSGAVASAAKRRAVAVLARDRVLARDGHSVEDELELARESIEAGRSKSIALGRYVGQFGRTNLYERVFDVSADDAKSIDFCTTQACRDEREKKTVHLKITKAAKARRIEGFASTPAIDRSQDVVDPTAFAESMPEFMKNPVMLWMHDMTRPVGKVIDFSVTNEGLWIAGEITDNQVWDWIDSGTVRALSSSFIIQERKIETLMAPEGAMPMQIRHITKAEMLEVSVVTIPDNRKTLFNVAKALANGDDMKCCGCETAASECACAETKAIVEPRRFGFAVAGPIDFHREAVVELGGIALDRMCKLIDQDGAPPMRHHGVQAGDVVTSIEAVRVGMAALVTHAPAIARLSEPERTAAYKHLAGHLAEAGIEAPLLGKGPEPERVAETLGSSERGEWTFIFDPTRFKDDAERKNWLREHGFAENANKTRVGEIIEKHALDDGVCAALYLATTSGDPVNVRKDVQGEAKPAAPAAPATPPAPTAPQPVAEPAASKASEPKAADEELVEIDTDDLAAIERVHDAVKNGDAVDPDDMKQAMDVFESDPS